MVASLGPNEVFGERALVDDLPRNLTAVATEETTLAEIDKGLFLFMVHETPTFALGIMGALASRLRDYDELFGSLARVERIDADLLIPGRGEPLRDASVVMDYEAITYVGPSVSAPGTPSGRVPVADARTLGVPRPLHGALDHGRLRADADPAGGRGGQSGQEHRSTLQAGFTSVREAGGLGVYLQRVIEEGILEGPTIYAPGSILSDRRPRRLPLVPGRSGCTTTASDRASTSSVTASPSA